MQNDTYIREGLASGNIRVCPHCESLGELVSGCNYIKCPACNGEWCWQCLKPKYKVIPSKVALGCCNDKSHNSH